MYSLDLFGHVTFESELGKGRHEYLRAVGMGTWRKD